MTADERWAVFGRLCFAPALIAFMVTWVAFVLPALALLGVVEWVGSGKKADLLFWLAGPWLDTKPPVDDVPTKK